MSFKKIVTKIYLEKEYKNIVECTDYKITAPDGFTFIHTMCPSGGMKEYIEHTDGTIEQIVQERAKRTVILDGIQINQVAPDILEYTSPDRKQAAKRYGAIKQELGNMGYVVKSHSCGELPKQEKPHRTKCPDLRDFKQSL